MQTSTSTPNIIKFEQSNEQTVADILKISGFVKARNLIGLIDSLDLEANPRSSKVGPVTDAIADSIRISPEEFPFKTKGILLGASQYKRLDRGRVSVNFENLEIEGILDGGHNTLAIGLHILRQTLGDEPRIKKVKLWADFRDLWNDSREAIREARKNEDAASDDFSALDLGFLVPVELLVPADPENPSVVDEFQSSLLDICAARNNNVQLRPEAKANQSGYFDKLRELLPVEIAERVEWKTNDGGTIKAADVVALAWIPLTVLEPLPADEDGKKVEAPVPQNVYRSKGDCVSRFERLMSSPAVTSDNTGQYKRELENPAILSALKVTAQLPDLYDQIYAAFPGIYNDLGGKYGRILAVKKMNTSARPKFSKFTHIKVDFNNPEGFIVPLVYGLQALLEVTEDGRVAWKTEPSAFLRDHLSAVVKQFSLMMAPLQYDPQKVGKAPESYTLAINAFETEYLREFGSAA